METQDLTAGNIRRAYFPDMEVKEPKAQLAVMIRKSIREKLDRYVRTKGLKISRVVEFALHQYLGG